MQRFWQLSVGLFFFGAGLLLSVLAAELLLHWFNPSSSLPKNGLVDGERYTWGHPVRINSFGARDEEPVVPKPEGTYRVLVLGDSLTWGAGIAEEERYTEAAAAGSGLEIINFAREGDPLVEYRDRLFEFGDTLQPDRIVVGFSINDTQPRDQNWSPERRMFIKNNAEAFKFFLRVGRHLPETGELLRDAYLEFGKRSGAFPPWPKALDRTYEKTSVEWRDFRRALTEMAKWSRGRKLDTPLFLALNQGSSTKAPTFYADPDPLLMQFLAWYDQALELAEESGFIAYDHRKEFAEQLNGRILGVNRYDGHPSAAEHRIYGEKLTLKLSADERVRATETS